MSSLPSSPCPYAAAITRRYGKSFFFASFALPRKVRVQAYAAYAMCRILDDIVDDYQGEDRAILLQEFLDFLWPEASSRQKPLSGVLLGAPLAVWVDLNESARAQFLRVLKEHLNQGGMRRVWVEELVKGQLSDLAFTQPVTPLDLHLYCYRVAGVVGLMMLPILGAQQDPETAYAAESLGHAMQHTNILRDIAEDALRGRVYLPIERIGRLAVDSLSHQASLDAWINDNETALLRYLDEGAALALKHYQVAYAGIASIPHWRGRLCVKLMIALYGAILALIKSAPRVYLRTRAVVPLRKRLVLGFLVCLGVSPLWVAGLRRG